MLPKCSQEPPKRLPRSPRTLPRGSKSVPRGSKILSRDPKITKISHPEPPRAIIDGSGSLPELPDEPQEVPKSLQEAPKKAPKSLQEAPKSLPELPKSSPKTLQASKPPRLGSAECAERLNNMDFCYDFSAFRHTPEYCTSCLVGTVLPFVGDIR